MKKQFEIIEELAKLTKESVTSISKLRIKIQEETQKIKSKLIDVYDNNLDILYLVDFYSDGMMHFHKADKEKVSTITLNWYDCKFRYKVPKNYEEGLRAIKDYPTPTNCDISSYNTFGYFHDIKSRYDRIDWISEKTQDKCYLFQVEESDFIKAMDSVHNHYAGNKLKDLQHYKDSTVNLYAFDHKIEDIFNEVLKLECKTITEQLMIDKVNYLKSIIFKLS